MQSSIADLHVDKSSGYDLSKEKYKNVYHQHKSDKTYHEILLYHLREKWTMNTLPVYYSFLLIYNLFSGGNIYKEQSQFKEIGGGSSREGRGFGSKDDERKCLIYQGTLRDVWHWLVT